MKHGLVFAKYGTLAASTRQRFVQTMPYLAQAGITLDILPLFDNAHLETLFKQGKHPLANTFQAYLKRFRDLLRARKYDFIWIQYELFPYLPAGFERLIRLSHKPIILDYDDAIFHQYDTNKNPFIRHILGNKLAALLRASQITFCGNAYLENYAKQHCTHTAIIPTTVDIDRYRSKTTTNETPVLGWIGSPSTWSYCVPLIDMFSSFVAQKKLSMLVIGAGSAANTALPFTFRDWKETREVEDIQHMDIGIMPLHDDPWARGKCGYKLIQYMVCGLPVIASPVGVNADIVEHGVNGFLASTPHEWHSAIETLLSDADLRQRMGKAGRAKIEAHYSIQQIGPRITQFIQDLPSQA